MAIDLSAAGRAFAPVTHVHDERDVMLYALAVGCGPGQLQFTYERGLKVLPTFAVIPSFPALLGVCSELQLDPLAILQSAQRVEWHAPIPTSGAITTTPTISAIEDKRVGALVVVDMDSVDEDGRLLFRTSSSIFARGEGGFGGPRTAREPRIRAPSRTPDVSTSIPTRPEQALLYRLCGDRNPLHADPDFARLAGLTRPILHGLCTFGIVGRAVLDAYADGDPERLKSLEGRFAGVVYPGETVTTNMWQVAPDAIALSALTERAETVLGSGLATLTA